MPKFTMSIESVFRYALYFALCLMCLLTYQIVAYRSNTPIEHLKGHLLNLLWCIPITAFIHVRYNQIQYSKSLIAYILVDYFKPRVDLKYRTEAKRFQRATLASKWVYDTIFFFATSLCGILLIKDNASFPDLLNFSPFCKGYYRIEVPAHLEWKLQFFYLIQCSYHLNNLIGQLRQFKPENKAKSYQFILHDVVALILICGSYFNGMWIQGILVYIWHDFSDAILHVSRIYMDMKNRNNFIFYSLGIFTLISWVITRVIIFPLCSLPEIYSLEVVPGSVITLSSMVILLTLMHIYWAYMMVGVALNPSKKKEKY